MTSEKLRVELAFLRRRAVRHTGQSLPPGLDELVKPNGLGLRLVRVLAGPRPQRRDQRRRVLATGPGVGRRDSFGQPAVAP